MKSDPPQIHPMAVKAFAISSFTNVGHLVHINLKEHLLADKYNIGKALLKSNKRALAVVNKVNTIDNEYRNFELEIIAKRPDCELTDEELMIVEVNENKCRFKMDFSQVYWNSRLSTEHERIIQKFNKQDIVFDLFAGVGPFSVPAGKRKCHIYANDLNPESVKWLRINMKRNKVNDDFYQVYNLDAKDFILNCMKDCLIREYMRVYQETDLMLDNPKVHIVMNLPALAPTFLTLFIGLLREDANKIICENLNLLTLFRQLSLEHCIYCYCFLKGSYDEPKQEVMNIIEQQLGRQLDTEQIKEIFKVRNVAPYKDMYRVEIDLDENLLFEPKGIMRNTGDRQTNGLCSPKKVTIKAPTKKRNYDESFEESLREKSTDNEEQCSPKRTRLGDYWCSIC